jgi:56kDa selenium binding protein (SBP56)
MFQSLKVHPAGFVAVALTAAVGCAAAWPAHADPPPQYLFLWTASADKAQPDFLAVLDVTESDGRYGRLVTTLPVPGRGNGPHHTEHEMPADGQLFANGFASGQSFVFDLRDPTQPRIVRQFEDLEGYSHPHSFLRLPNGNVLATFQMKHDHGSGAARTGGLVELTPGGLQVRSGSADGAGVGPGSRVYSGQVVPSLDRIVTTTTDMHRDDPASRNVQTWRLSDLALLHTFPLPDGPAGGEGSLTAEPRLLPDGKTVLVSTFSCGLYLMDGLDGDAPSGRLVASFPRKPKTFCAIPVISGHYYLVTVPAWNSVVSLDISDPSAPREVSRLTLGPEDVPHWIAISPDQRRVVVTGYEALQHRAVIARFDPASGQLTIDERFREEGASQPGFRMDDKNWPHGGDAKGIPHGAVFSRP